MRRREFPPVHADTPNLAPMVDVVMVILIFFMLGTSFALPEGVLPTQLPSQVGPGGAASVTVIPAVRIVLQETENRDVARIIVMERELPDNSFASLRAFMSEKLRAGADPSARVLIGAEPGVAYQQVISAMDACVRAGFSNIQFGLSSSAASSVLQDEGTR